MDRGELVSILGRGRRHGFRRWGTASVISSDAHFVRVQFDGGDPFDAHRWDDRDAMLEPPVARSILFARPLPVLYVDDDVRSCA